MGLWSGIKYALNSSIGTDDFKPLDKMLDVKVQTVTFNFPRSNDTSVISVTKTIENIDVDKTIIIPISVLNVNNLGIFGSISFELSSPTSITANQFVSDTQIYTTPFSYTVQLLTFNANVEKL